MRILNTMVCAGVLMASTFAAASADELLGVHPEIGDIKPREFLNKDLLSLSKREQQVWIHGAMTQMIQTLAAHNPENGKCVMDWYFSEGNGAEYIPNVIDHYKNASASVTLIAAARKVCPIKAG